MALIGASMSTFLLQLREEATKPQSGAAPYACVFVCVYLYSRSFIRLSYNT